MSKAWRHTACLGLRAIVVYGRCTGSENSPPGIAGLRMRTSYFGSFPESTPTFGGSSDPRPELDFIWAKSDSCPQLLDRIVQRKLDRAVVLYDAQSWPGGPLAAKHRLTHETRRRIREHTGEMCIRDLWKDGYITRVPLTKHGHRLCQDVWKDAKFCQCVHTM